MGWDEERTANALAELDGAGLVSVWESPEGLLCMSLRGQDELPADECYIPPRERSERTWRSWVMADPKLLTYGVNEQDFTESTRAVYETLLTEHDEAGKYPRLRRKTENGRPVRCPVCPSRRTGDDYCLVCDR